MGTKLYSEDTQRHNAGWQGPLCQGRAESLSLTQGMASQLKAGERGARGRPCRLRGLYRCPASRMRQATAVMRAAPFPLPSSDSRKDTSHLGARSFTVACMTLAKLEVGKRRGKKP